MKPNTILPKPVPKTPAEIARERFLKEVGQRFGPIPTGIVKNVVVEGLRQKNAKRDDGGDNVVGWYSPSMGWKCMRNAFYEFFKYPYEREPSGIMRLGELMETDMQGWLSERYGDKFVKNDYPIFVLVVDAGDHYEIVVPGPEDPDPDFTGEKWMFKNQHVVLVVRGYTDFYIQGYNGKVRVLFEGKSIYNIRAAREVKDHHMHQVAPYHKATRAEQTRVVYYERNDLTNIAEFEVGNNELEVAFFEAMEWFIEFHQFVVDKQLPPDKPINPDWECRYCPFVDQCRKDGGSPNVR